MWHAHRNVNHRHIRWTTWYSELILIISAWWMRNREDNIKTSALSKAFDNEKAVSWCVLLLSTATRLALVESSKERVNRSRVCLYLSKGCLHPTGMNDYSIPRSRFQIVQRSVSTAVESAFIFQRGANILPVWMSIQFLAYVFKWFKGKC
jgi:hypothetical protein